MAMVLKNGYPIAMVKNYAMSCPAEANVEDETYFKWGNKRGNGAKNKDVQFYESFTYKGVEFFLYDCVYFYKAGDFETSTGCHHESEFKIRYVVAIKIDGDIQEPKEDFEHFKKTTKKQHKETMSMLS
ncbi:protein ANTI-SILENCING 1 isoform X1 [Senna tora]|uniref:Protein ANTI-SILENCING 1 isoform X1 n=1 Tax=Senna tora TaxID=362788 RepID=A0A834WHS3_9FABA|nr:protein ANTI-SILENCING 1 isoform X1 [Senna tora]